MRPIALAVVLLATMAAARVLIEASEPTAAPLLADLVAD